MIKKSDTGRQDTGSDENVTQKNMHQRVFQILKYLPVISVGAMQNASFYPSYWKGLKFKYVMLVVPMNAGKIWSWTYLFIKLFNFYPVDATTFEISNKQTSCWIRKEQRSWKYNATFMNKGH